MAFAIVQADDSKRIEQRFEAMSGFQVGTFYVCAKDCRGKYIPDFELMAVWPVVGDLVCG